jgi:hypothetical protein
VPVLTRYAEIRALVGGVTAVQGAAVNAQPLEESLVRNVDRRIFGQHRGRSIVDLDRVRPAELEGLHRDLDSHQIDAIFVHLAEGVDEASSAELELLKSARLLVPETVIIHGTALTDKVGAADDPHRIVISVGMLKEGWDNRSVYVITSMRASVSTILTEQTLGRGLRLPYRAASAASVDPRQRLT